MQFSRGLAAPSLALLALALAVSAQRSSPQFTFSSPGPSNSQPSQFSSDLFSPNLQDSSLQEFGNSAGSLQQPALNSFTQLGTPSAPLSFQADQPQPAAPQLLQPLTSQSQIQRQQDQNQLQAQLSVRQADSQAQREQQSSVQLARPSLSLTSLTSALQQQQQQQPASSSNSRFLSSLQAPQVSVSTSTSSSLTSSATQSAPNSRQQQQQLAPASRQSSRTIVSQPAAATAVGAASQPTGSQQQSRQHTVESARRAEASAASQAASSGHAFQCPDSFGFYRHHKSCDKYWACENGTATLKLCGNGLMFDDSDPRRENCAYPFSVDCGNDRTDLEPPISTPHCPRLYGLFADQTNCRVFYSCWNGEASKYECPPGLAYDNEQRVCVWADLVSRCDQSEVSDGFVCPDPTEVDQPGHYTRHAHPTDCRKFYVCIDNVARPYGCSFGNVFNVDSLQCDEPENVSGCEKYYGDLDPKTAKKLARESGAQIGGNNDRRGFSSTPASSSSTRGESSRQPEQ